jgi:hypothetical protein
MREVRVQNLRVFYVEIQHCHKAVDNIYHVLDNYFIAMRTVEMIKKSKIFATRVK